MFYVCVTEYDEWKENQVAYFESWVPNEENWRSISLIEDPGNTHKVITVLGDEEE